MYSSRDILDNHDLATADEDEDVKELLAGPDVFPILSGTIVGLMHHYP